MDKPERKFDLNIRVKLRDGVHAGFYKGYGLPGNEGWIRKHDIDKYGYHRVFIEWDKNHWAYNGVSNGWTWEGHFEKAEDPIMTEKDKTPKPDDAARIAAAVQAALESYNSNNSKPTEPEPEVEQDEDIGIYEIMDERVPEDEESDALNFETTLNKAAAAARDSEAFILIAVRQEEQPGFGTVIAPIAYHGSKDTSSSLFCQLQLVHLAGAFTERLAEERLADIIGDDDEEDNE